MVGERLKYVSRNLQRKPASQIAFPSWGKQAPGEGIPADDFGQPWKLRRGKSSNALNCNDNYPKMTIV